MSNDQTKKLIVAVLFGGRTAEHEVSIISAHQAMEALEVAGFQVEPIYVTKSGTWYHGRRLFDISLYRGTNLPDPGTIPGVRLVLACPGTTRTRLAKQRSLFGIKFLSTLAVDVVLPAIHGSFGEDGSLQGLLDLLDLPYVGSNVTASAVGMDKVLSKRIYSLAGLNTLPDVTVDRSSRDLSSTLSRALEHLGGFPIISKPVRLGSSIGVIRSENLESLRRSVELALALDSQVMLEPALDDFDELNCAVIGPPCRVSAIEMPHTEASVLSFDEKYKRGGKGKLSSEGMASLERTVPAEIPDDLRREVEEQSRKAFSLIGASGLARVDFMYDRRKKKLYINEINTIPGSFAFYLWEEVGVRFDELMEALVEIALDCHKRREATQFSFMTDLLSGEGGEQLRSDSE